MNCLAEAHRPGPARQRHDPGDLGRPQVALRARVAADRRDGPGVRPSSAPGHGLLPREIATAGGLRQRDDPRHGDGRQHQHRAPHPGDRPRGRRAVHARADRRAEPARRPTSARSARRAATTSRTSPAPGASTRSSARSPAAARACSTSSCPTVTGKTLGENIDEYDVRGATADAGRPAADPGPARRRADQPGLDRAQRRRRGPLAGRRAGPPRGRGRRSSDDRRRRRRQRSGRTATGRRRLRPVRRDPHRRQRLFADRRPDDALRATSPPRARS